MYNPAQCINQCLYHLRSRLWRDNEVNRIVFLHWHFLEVTDRSWQASLPACPCAVQCESDLRYDCRRNERWVATYCNHPGTEEYQDFGKAHVPYDRERFHPGACVEIRTSGSPSQQCTYDRTGQLITGGPAAGSPDRHPGTIGALITYVLLGGSHMEHDVYPYNLALQLDGGTPGFYVGRFLGARPANNANNCPHNVPGNDANVEGCGPPWDSPYVIF